MMMNHGACGKHIQQDSVQCSWSRKWSVGFMCAVESELWTEHDSNRYVKKKRSEDRIIFPTSSLMLQSSRELIT
jgi:hypothetical protein